MIRKPFTTGFTLIEMIVSLALFSVAVTISVGALLVLIASNRQLQDEQNVLTNLSFALDSMSREIRTGSAYVCLSRSSLSGSNNPFGTNNLDSLISSTLVADCATGRNRNASGIPTGVGLVHGISFVESGDSITGVGNNRIVYFHDSDSQALYRRIANQPAQRITSDSIIITDADFHVTGSRPLESAGANRLDQPTVTIFIRAAAAATPGAKEYPLQTTVVQRTLDL